MISLVISYKEEIGQLSDDTLAYVMGLIQQSHCSILALLQKLRLLFTKIKRKPISKSNRFVKTDLFCTGNRLKK